MIQETGVAENNSISMSINFPIVTVGETLTFATAPGTLTNVSAGTSINETISAVASQGSAVTYSFVSTNNKNMNGRGGTAIIITGNIYLWYSSKTSCSCYIFICSHCVS